MRFWARTLNSDPQAIFREVQTCNFAFWSLIVVRSWLPSGCCAIHTAAAHFWRQLRLIRTSLTSHHDCRASWMTCQYQCLFASLHSCLCRKGMTGCALHHAFSMWHAPCTDLAPMTGGRWFEHGLDFICWVLPVEALLNDDGRRCTGKCQTTWHELALNDKADCRKKAQCA